MENLYFYTGTFKKIYSLILLKCDNTPKINIKIELGLHDYDKK